MTILYSFVKYMENDDRTKRIITAGFVVYFDDNNVTKRAITRVTPVASDRRNHIFSQDIG